MSQLYSLYKAVGNKEFSKKICEFAPYFSTIDPEFVDLRPNFAKVKMPNSRKVHNHLGTVHAIAMCNLAEIVAGLLTDVSIPDTHRWIPIGMSVKYLAKATSDLTGFAETQYIDWNSEGKKDVLVRIIDDNNVDVCEATISMKVSLKEHTT